MQSWHISPSGGRAYSDRPMAKTASVQHSCTECGTHSGRWLGRCPGCGSFGTLVAEAVPTRGVPAGVPARPLLRLVDVVAEEMDRITRGLGELDRVLGGGLVPASLVLVGGEPGVGKSTLLLSPLGSDLARRRAPLVTGEESLAQTRCAPRGSRLRSRTTSWPRPTGRRLRDEAGAARRLILDSVQTLSSPEHRTGPGSVAEVREAAHGCCGSPRGRASPPCSSAT